MSWSGAPIYLTSVKAIDERGEEQSINVRVQKSTHGLYAEFGYPKMLLSCYLNKDVAIGKLHIPIQYIEKLQKFCS